MAIQISWDATWKLLGTLTEMSSLRQTLMQRLTLTCSLNDFEVKMPSVKSGFLCITQQFLVFHAQFKC